jgi:hypothetical protein
MFGSHKSLRSRLEKLEAQRCVTAPATTCSGIVVKLADDFVGERHIVMVSRRQTDLPHADWCVFEERPGLGLDETEGANVIYLSQTDVNI